MKKKDSSGFSLPKLHKAGKERFLGATVTIDDNFLKVVPKKALSGPPGPLNKSCRPGPGIAYANAKGDLLLSLQSAEAPRGFEPVGQASVHVSEVVKWKSVKASTVESTGDLRI